MESKNPQCAKCPVMRCRTRDKSKKLPDFCPTKNFPELTQDSLDKNRNDPDIRAVNEAWFQLVDRISKNRWNWTRLDEIMEYAGIRGIKKIGIAACAGLLFEARLLTNILEKRGFEVISVSCMAGEVTPEDAGFQREGPFCNPIIQAGILNRVGTELNLMVGLCVGHDILFLRYSEADVTPFIVKDRALGHNPAAALYLSENYYKERFDKSPGG